MSKLEEGRQRVNNDRHASPLTTGSHNKLMPTSKATTTRPTIILSLSRACSEKKKTMEKRNPNLTYWKNSRVGRSFELIIAANPELKFDQGFFHLFILAD